MKILSLQEFNPAAAPRGVLVDQKTVQAHIDETAPIMCRFWTAQAGRPWATRYDVETESYRNTFLTFRRIPFPPNTWKYCGDCFPGETRPRGVQEGAGGAFFTWAEGCYLRIMQADPDGELTVKRIDDKRGTVKTDLIGPQEFIELFRYFYTIKYNNIYHKFINPGGTEKNTLEAEG